MSSFSQDGEVWGKISVTCKVKVLYRVSRCAEKIVSRLFHVKNWSKYRISIIAKRANCQSSGGVSCRLDHCKVATKIPKSQTWQSSLNLCQMRLHNTVTYDHNIVDVSGRVHHTSSFNPGMPFESERRSGRWMSELSSKSTPLSLSVALSCPSD